MDRSAQVAVSGATGFVYDEGRDILYVTSSTGVLHRWSAQSASFLSSLSLGGSLSDVAISADGRFLLVGQNVTTNLGTDWSSRGEATVHRVMLDSLAVQNLTFSVTGYERGVVDVAVTAGDFGLVATSFNGSGTTPLRRFDAGASSLTSASLTGLRDVGAPADLILSENQRYVLVLEGNNSGGPMHIFDSSAGRIIASGGIGGFNTGHADISASAGLVANSTYNNTVVYDFTMARVQDLSYLNNAGGVAGVQFSEDGRQLFVWEVNSDDLVVFDTTSWKQVARLDVRTDVGFTYNGANWGEMTTGDDGRLMFLDTPNGFEVIDLAERLVLRLEGGAGADALFGAVAADSLAGGGGDDLLGGGGGDDRLDGGAGVDTATFERTKRAGVTVDLAAGTGNGADTGADVLISIENVRGSEFADSLIGDAGDNRLEGRSGDDVLNGAGGNDLLEGGQGADRLFGAAGDDVLMGGAGDDEIDGGAGADRVVLGAPQDADVITLGAGRDTVAFGQSDVSSPVTAANPGRVRIADFQAGDGGDRIELSVFLSGVGGNPFGSGVLRLVQSGADTLLQANRGPGGFVTVLTLANVDRFALTADNFAGFDPGRLVIGSEGDDRLGGGEGPDVIGGLAGADFILGGFGADQLFGDAGDDIIGGQEGDDFLNGNAGRDLLVGDAGNDFIIGGFGDDELRGGDGDDRMGGQEDNDFLNGEGGRDFLFGDSGNDLIIGGRGDDELRGGDGDDRMGGQEDNDFLDGGDGRDSLFGDSGSDLIIGGAGNDELIGGEGDDRMGGQDGDDFLNGEVGRDFLFGDGGNDLILGGFGGDELRGGDGDDRMGGQEDNDFLDGGAGRDLLFGDGGNDHLVGGGDRDELRGGDGDDLIGGQDGDDFIDGGSGRDTLFGDSGADHIVGGDQDDALIGQDGDDLIGGQEGSDFIDGGVGRDTLFGDAGDDRIVGGAGDDRLDGGGGLDTAIFAGARSGYTITVSNGVTTVSGADGTDTLVGFERLQFDDGVLTAGPAGSDGTAAPWVEPSTAAPVASDWMV